MGKHVQARGSRVIWDRTRLDADPMLFFELRDIDSKGLVKKSVEQKLESMLKNAGKKSKRQIAGKDIADIFGL